MRPVPSGIEAVRTMKQVRQYRDWPGPGELLRALLEVARWRTWPATVRSRTGRR